MHVHFVMYADIVLELVMALAAQATILSALECPGITMHKVKCCLLKRQ